MGCVALGAMFSLAVFLAPMSAETGWSRAGISFAMTINFIVMAFGSFAWGAASDRWGARVCTLLGGFAVITILTKNSVLEEIRKQYVLTARAKGVDEGKVLWRHVFRNAMIPIMTGFPAAFVGAFFSGSLLIETLFSLDGLGLLSYESVIRRDYPVVFGSLFLFTIIGLLTTLLRDLSYLWVDPRVRFFD